MNKIDWKTMREKRAFLALEDGTIMRGYSVGAPVDALGEVVFNTGMTGYQEILTDPSYAGQFVTMTYPEIGNTGINSKDIESAKAHLSGFIMHSMNTTSNWRASESLREYLAANDKPAIAGLDTRALTSRLRDKGTLKGFLSVSETVSEEEALKKCREWCGLDGQDYAAKVSCKEEYKWDVDDKMTTTWGMPKELVPADLRVVVYDFGIKYNILRNLRIAGMDLTVVPCKTPASEIIAMKPDGVFFSNGPADPAAVTYGIDAAKELLGKLPIMGICLGHQILGIATGARTGRLKFGHHGCNHPVKDLRTGLIDITSQNHNFCVMDDSIDTSKIEITHINLNDNSVEGILHLTEPMFSVQYHPEAAPGPHDPAPLFTDFADMIKKS
jgi:carbamoyl-phosphate synthase small subunit